MSKKGERLAKRIANSGVCSRRDAEKLITEGKVHVNGVLVTTPALNVTAKDHIAVDGIPLSAQEAPRLWGYYKPAGVLTTHKDPQGRPTLFSELPTDLPRVISIGRLDLNSEGLILLTNDARLARHAELPSTGWPRCYKVRVFGTVDEKQLANLIHGIEIEGIAYGRIEADLIRQSGRNAWLTVTLYEGKNREIRKIMEHLGLRVNRLIRLAYGPFQLKQHQPRTLWEIPTNEFTKHFPFLNEPKLKKDAHYRRKI
jgi:23S rRNA pseudouridine2605 synthase